MASGTCFIQSSSLSYALLPFLYRRTTLLSTNLRQLHSFSSKSLTTKSPLMKVFAQARRFSPKQVEIASTDDILFESPLKIVKYPDPILRAGNKRIGTFDENLKKLVFEMFDIMYKTDGIGLSAPQVGMNIRLMVFNPAGERGVGEEIVLINPRVQKYSRKMVLFDEGCLSFPGIYAGVQRPESVKVDAQDITGENFSVDLSRLPARVFQHEFDHLQGTLFFDRMTEEVVDSIREELQALEKKYEDRTGFPSPEKIGTSKARKVVTGFGRS
ncbi:hypothetical protein GIB67_004332 [Kingdonia uniflora]|uniref:Peptide deformylase n=1 Tax=Kingdonia uniflora TaxID=39325 RepID=A0A7J7MRC4_9MAGN|nr:hypothetical protein GIB67_004332 [Kingdonia uniflora]